jgi:hypothetical protein
MITSQIIVLNLNALLIEIHRGYCTYSNECTSSYVDGFCNLLRVPVILMKTEKNPRFLYKSIRQMFENYL